MTEVTPERLALYALQWNVPRSELSMAAQLEYDRLRPAWERGEARPAAGELEAARLAWDQESSRTRDPGQLDYDRFMAPWEQDAARRAGLARRHEVNRSGTIHTFRAMRGSHLGWGIAAVVFGVGVLVGDAAGLAYPSSSFARGDGGVSTSDSIWMAVISLLFIWLGIRLLRAGIQVSAGQMTYRGYLHTRTVDASEIRAITLKPHRQGEGTAWVPRVELAGGKSFWMDSFACGPTRKPPNPHRAADLGEVRMLLSVRAADVGRPDNRQGT